MRRPPSAEMSNIIQQTETFLQQKRLQTGCATASSFSPLFAYVKIHENARVDYECFSLDQNTLLEL